VALGLILVLANSLTVFWLAQAQEEPPHWEYEGELGPEAWGKINPRYALCGEGRAQSPIDLTGAATLDLSDIVFNYAPSALTIFNNGHTVQANYNAGSSITYNENRYDLVQLHFHNPSEHSINGQRAAMELHLVHRDANGALAVVGVLLIEGETDNAAFAPLFENLPAEEGEPTTLAQTIDALALLPATRTFYTYMGSLTTPPCTQGVRWLVLTEPVRLSAAQLEAFAELFPLNARPVQALNARDLLQDSR